MLIAGAGYMAEVAIQMRKSESTFRGSGDTLEQYRTR